MKTFIFSLLFAGIGLLPVKLLAQDNGEAVTLFGTVHPINPQDLGAFAVPSFSFTQMDGAAAYLAHFRAGLIYKDQVSLGAYANVSISDIFPESETESGIYMDYWSVGGFAEYTLHSSRLVHLSLPLYLGFGEVEMDDEIGDVDFREANFLTTEPSVVLEVNLHRYVRFNAGLGYRLVSSMTYRNLDQSDLSGLTGYVGLKIGVF